MTRKSKRTSEQPQPDSTQARSDEEILPAQGTGEASAQPSSEDLLAETRHALIEEQKQAEKNVGVLKKMTGRLRATGILKGKPKKTARASEREEAELRKRLEENVEEKEASATAEDIELEAETKAILEALEEAESTIPLVEEAEAAVSIEAEVKPLEESPAPIMSSTTKPGYHELREVALEGYEDPPPEALVPPRPSINEQIGNLTGQIKYQTLMRITIASLTAVVCMAIFLIGSWAMNVQPFNSLHAATATVTATMPVPYPIQVRLPGGWMFTLSRGAAVNGKWAPTKAEWLEGTEICRWVSLPWSEQLEAVFHTLKKGDRIDLVMSNYDHWSYRVRSVEDKQVYELSEMNTNYPSLLLILTKADSDTRVVVLAVP